MFFFPVSHSYTLFALLWNCISAQKSIRNAIISRKSIWKVMVRVCVCMRAKKEYGFCLKTKEKQIFATASLIIFKSFVLLCMPMFVFVFVCVCECFCSCWFCMRWLLCVQHRNTKTLVIIYCKVGVDLACLYCELRT